MQVMAVEASALNEYDPSDWRPYSASAGVLSYLVPGLGQISQGRVAKGFLFLGCLYGLFFFGMYLGDWKNVYLPHCDPCAASHREVAGGPNTDHRR